MGIPGFFAYLSERFKYAMYDFQTLGKHKDAKRSDGLPLGNKDYDGLFFDVNNLLYLAASHPKANFTTIFQELQMKLEQIITLYTCPLVYVAVDGPGPVAKFLTQRARRVKSAAPSRDGEKSSSDFETLNFTPGTEMMELLTLALDYFSCSQLEKKPLIQDFIFSPAERPGEGELKIFEYITAQSAPSHKLSKKLRYLVVGNDADLLLYALKTTNVHVDILRIRPDGTYVLVNVQHLKELMRSACQLPVEKTEEIATDFVFMSTFLGNDYIPLLRGFSIREIWNNYTALRLGLFKGQQLYDEHTRTINTTFFKQLLQQSSLRRFSDPTPRLYKVDSILSHMVQKWVSSAASYIFNSNLESDGTWSVTLKMLWPHATIAQATGPTEQIAKRTAMLQALGLKMDETNSNYEVLPAAQIQDLPLVKFIREESNLDVPSYIGYLSTKLSQLKRDVEREINEGVTPKLNEFLRGSVWMMEYMKAKCHDYNYRYSYPHGPSVDDLIKNIDKVDYSLSQNDSKPLPTLMFLATLLPSNSPNSRKFVPEPFRNSFEKGQALGDLYNLAQSEIFWMENPTEAIERIKTEIGSVSEELKEKYRNLFEASPARKYQRAKSSETGIVAPAPPGGFKAVNPMMKFDLYEEQKDRTGRWTGYEFNKVGRLTQTMRKEVMNRYSEDMGATHNAAQEVRGHHQRGWTPRNRFNRPPSDYSAGGKAVQFLRSTRRFVK
eukprot:TRINITY_DN7310_c0_g1_i1.p1 TRINITY_DN7310_c0_g1~~TRINITY_DN7310_c0_g1_i1.p1  ORF type:complete len:721 (+),score=125.24 TRINITY_DN7310_c0_g1_i1:52-2214(+)